MLQLSYETNSLLPGSHPHVSRGHIRSNNGANKRGEEGRGQESPQQPDCVMRKLSKEDKKKGKIKLKPHGHFRRDQCWQQRHLTQQNLINSFEIYGVMLQ